MSTNHALSFHFFYIEAVIRDLDAWNLAKHVQITTAKLGIPTPAKAHVKKAGEGTVFIELLSCHPSTLKKVEQAIKTAARGELRNTDLGLIAIHCLDTPPTSLPAHTFHPSNLHPTSNHSSSDSPSPKQAKNSTASNPGTLLNRISEGRPSENEPMPVINTHRLDATNSTDTRFQSEPTSIFNRVSEAPSLQSFNEAAPSPTHSRYDPSQSSSVPSASNSTGPEMGKLLTRISDSPRPEVATLSATLPRRVDGPNLSHAPPTQPASFHTHKRVSEASPLVPPQNFNQITPKSSPPTYPPPDLSSQTSARNSTVPEHGTLLTRISDGRHPDGKSLPTTHPHRAEDPKPPDAPKSFLLHTNVSQTSPSFKHRVSSPTPAVYHRPHSPSQPPGKNSPVREMGTLLTRISDGRRSDWQIQPPTHPRGVDKPSLSEGHHPVVPRQSLPVSYPRGENTFAPDTPMQPKSVSVSSHGNISQESPLRPASSGYHLPHSPSYPRARDVTASEMRMPPTYKSNDRRSDETQPPTHPRVVDKYDFSAGHRPDVPAQGLSASHSREAGKPNPSDVAMQAKSVHPLSTVSQSSLSSNQSVSKPVPPSYYRPHSPSQPPQRNSTAIEVGSLLTRLSHDRRSDGQTLPADSLRRAEDPNMHTIQSQLKLSSGHLTESKDPLPSGQSRFGHSPPVAPESQFSSQPPATNSMASERASLLTRISESHPERETSPVNSPHRTDEPFDAKQHLIIPHNKRSESPPRQRQSSLALDSKSSQPPDSNRPRAPLNAENDTSTSIALFSRNSRSPMRSELPLKARISLGDDDNPPTSWPTHTVADDSFRPVLKREPDVDEGGESKEHVLHKRRKLDNVPAQSYNSSQQDAPINRTTSKIFSTPLDLGSGRDEDRSADLQRLRKQVSELERELTKERNEVNLIQNELDKEREKRARAELIVEDVRREMREPFIVPSLLDAFISITDIPNVCMEKEAL